MVTTPPTPLVDTMAFANRFTTLRKNANLTQDALANAVGVHVSQIRRYEAGTSTPTLDVLRNIALALHTSADSLVFDPDERAPTDDLRLIFEAIKDLDTHHQQLARELLEAITHRAHAHRWQQPAAS